MNAQSVSAAILMATFTLASVGCSKEEAGSVEDQVNQLIEQEQEAVAKKLAEQPIITPPTEPVVVSNVIPEVPDNASACARPKKLNVVSISDEGLYDENHSPANVLDNDFSPESRWSAEGENRWLLFDLGGPATITNLEIAFFKGDGRQAFYDIETSVDNQQWIPVLENGTSSGTTLDMQYIEVADTDARFVRILGNGTTQNAWSAYTEVEIYGCML
jgi:poly(beta-D-mannuronate) lyase